MLKIVESIFAFISFVLLTSAWVYLTSTISYYLNMVLKLKNIRPNLVAYSIVLGISLEIMLSICSLLLPPLIPDLYSGVDSGILSGLEKGCNFAILLSPLCSMVGAVLGIKRNRRHAKHFRF